MAELSNIPDKLYFKIGEVSDITGVPAYVLRFWESEFSRIRPKRTSSGQRLYRKNDIELILNIKQLLHVKKFTIRGAKQHLKNDRPDMAAPARRESMDLVKEIKNELMKLRNLLD